MATRWFKGAGTAWNTANDWASSVGGVDNAGVPVAADDVVFTNASGSCSLITTAGACRSFDMGTGATKYTNTFSGSANLTISGTTAVAGNNTFRISSGCTWTHTGTVSVNNTTAVTHLITFGTKTLGGGFTFGGTTNSPTYQFQDAVSITGAFNITGGAGNTVDFNNQSVSCGNIGWTAKIVNLTSSVVTTTGTTCTITPTTLNASTSEILMNSAGTVTFTGTSKSFYKVTRIGTAVLTDQFSIAGDFTVTNQLKVRGGSTSGGINRLLVRSSVLGTQRVVTMTGATVNITGDVDFLDTSVDGGTAPTWTNISNFVGDCGNNSTTIVTNRTAPTTQTATGTASFSWSTHGWTTHVPLPQDTVSIPNAFVAGRTVTADMPRWGGNISFTCTGSPILAFGAADATGAIFGSFTFASGMTTSASPSDMILGGRGTGLTLTTNSVTIAPVLTFNCAAGDYALQDTCTVGNNATCCVVTSGTLKLNGQTLQTINTNGPNALISVAVGATLDGAVANSTLLSQHSTAGTPITLGAGTVTNGSTMLISTNSTTSITQTFALGGNTVGNISTTGAGKIGTLSITGNNTIGSLTHNATGSLGIVSIGGTNTWTGTWTIGPSRTVQVASGATQTFNNTNALGGVQGQNYGYIRFTGQATGNYVSANDIAAYTGAGIMRGAVRVALDDWTPAATQVLLAHSNTSGNQRGWQFFVTAATGTLTFQASSDGSAFGVNQASSSPALVDGTAYWVGYEYNTAGGANNLTFYKANDQVNEPAYWGGWTQVSQHTVTGITPFNSTAGMTVGENASSVSTGNFYRAVFYTSSTTLQFDANFTGVTGTTGKAFGVNTFTESSSNAAIVTLNALAQQGDGRVTLQAASGTSTLATTGGSTMISTVPDHILATPAGAVYVLDGADGGSNTGIIFDPPDQVPQEFVNEQREFTPAGNTRAVIRAGRW